MTFREDRAQMFEFIWWHGFVFDEAGEIRFSYIRLCCKTAKRFSIVRSKTVENVTYKKIHLAHSHSSNFVIFDARDCKAQVPIFQAERQALCGTQEFDGFHLHAIRQFHANDLRA
jgi:hypothetical protein